MKPIILLPLIFAIICLLSCCKKQESENNRNAEPDVDTISEHCTNTESGIQPGYEYLSDSVFENDFYFFNTDNYELVSKQMQENVKINNRKYHNHFLYCLDTISNYKDFVCFSAEYFERLCPIAWGVFYTDCELVNNDTLSVAEFEILKYNTIHGASLIVNSCLFNTYIPYGEDKVRYADDEFFLFRKYYIPNCKKEKFSDSLMLKMLADIEKLCAKYDGNWFSKNMMHQKMLHLK